MFSLSAISCFIFIHFLMQSHCKTWPATNFSNQIWLVCCSNIGSGMSTHTNLKYSSCFHSCPSFSIRVEVCWHPSTVFLTELNCTCWKHSLSTSYQFLHECIKFPSIMITFNNFFAASLVAMFLGVPTRNSGSSSNKEIDALTIPVAMMMIARAVICYCRR